MASAIAQRARSVRDAGEAGEPLLYQPEFARKLLLHAVWEAAKTSKPAAALKSSVDGARALGERLPTFSESKD